MATPDNQAACFEAVSLAEDAAPDGKDPIGLQIMAIQCRIGAYDMLERSIAHRGPDIDRSGTASHKSKLRHLRHRLAQAMAIGADGRRVGRPNLEDPLMRKYLEGGYFELAENPDGSPRVWWSRHRYGPDGERFSSDVGSSSVDIETDPSGNVAAASAIVSKPE